jgi:hypothetical protein
VRKQIRYLSAQKIKTGDPKSVMNLLPDEPTLAQLIAANTLIRASRADMRAVEFVDTRIDGEMPKININSDLQRLADMTDEELREYSESLDRELERIRDSSATSPNQNADGSAAETGAGEETAATAVDSVSGTADGSVSQQS